jgi:hypothetical protein
VFDGVDLGGSIGWKVELMIHKVYLRTPSDETEVACIRAGAQGDDLFQLIGIGRQKSSYKSVDGSGSYIGTWAFISGIRRRYLKTDPD